MDEHAAPGMNRAARRRAAKEARRAGTPARKPSIPGDQKRQQRVYWPRELEFIFRETTQERVRVAASSASKCAVCGEALGNEDLSYQCVTSTPPRLRARVEDRGVTPPITINRINHWISHARCRAPKVTMGDVQPAPDMDDSIWRTGWLVDGRPWLVVQPSFDTIERNQRGENRTAWVAELQKRGFQWMLGADELAAIDMDRPTVGMATFEENGAFSVRADEFQIIDGNLGDCGEKESVLWRDSAASLGRFLLISGTGMHLPIEGDFDLDQAIKSGKIVWGWIEATVNGVRC